MARMFEAVLAGNMLNLSAITPFVPAWNAPGAAIRPFVGELILVLTIVAILLTPFFTPRRSNIPCAAVALIGLVAAFISMFAAHVTAVTGQQFGGMLVSDSVAVLFKAILYLFTAGIVLMWFATTSVSMREGDGPEFFTLLIGAVLGLSLMGSTSNLLMIFLAIELASLPSYVLAGFRKTERLGAEASLKYVLFGAVASAIMIFGLSYLYGIFGTLDFGAIAKAIAAGAPDMAIVAIGLICLLVGIGFKIALVPLHFWCPDVFEGAGVDVAAFLSVASKAAGLILLMRLLQLIGNAYNFSPAPLLTTIAILIGTLGAVTATVANTAAFFQTDIKRLLAYSSIAHAGYMLCALPLVLDTSSPTIIQAILIYLCVYLFMNLGAFTVAGLLERHDGSTDIVDYAALGRRSPMLAACMALFLISLIGLPPLAGFIAKLNIMWLLGAAGTWWWALVAIIAVNTIISVYYYARVIKAMYFAHSQKKEFFPDPLGLGMATICATLLVAMLVFFSALWQITGNYSTLTESSPTNSAVAASSPAQP